METTHINDEMTTVVQTSRNLGVNAQVVSSMVVANLDKMNRYGFGTGVEGMAKMAAKAAAMRVDMSTTLNVAEKLFSPEAAIDVAASLQRLGATSGALLDPLKLMDLAQNNVPELQNQLSELSKTFTKFDKETGQFQIMPQARQQLKEVADALGIDRAEFEKMALESAKIEKKMGEIDFSGLKFTASEDQKMMLANMAQFNKSKGSYEITVKDKDGKFVQESLQNLTKAQLDDIAKQQEFEKKDSGLQLVDLAKEQLLSANQLASEVKAIGSLLPTQFAIGKSGNDFLTNAVSVQSETFKKTFETLDLKKGGAEGALGEFQGIINDLIMKGEAPDAAKIEELFANVLSKFGDITADNEKRLSNASAGVEIYSDIKLATAGFSLANEMSAKFAETLKGTTGDLSGWQKGLALGIPLLKQAYDAFIGNKTTNSETQTNANPTPPTNNSTSQTSSSNTNSPAGNNNATLTAQVNKIEHKIELTVKTDINNTEVAAAVTKAFSNDDTLRELRTAIATVASDYGLTET